MGKIQCSCHSGLMVPVGLNEQPIIILKRKLMTIKKFSRKFSAWCFALKFHAGREFARSCPVSFILLPASAMLKRPSGVWNFEDKVLNVKNLTSWFHICLIPLSLQTRKSMRCKTCAKRSPSESLKLELNINIDLSIQDFLPYCWNTCSLEMAHFSISMFPRCLKLPLQKKRPPMLEGWARQHLHTISPYDKSTRFLFNDFLVQSTHPWDGYLPVIHSSPEGAVIFAGGLLAEGPAGLLTFLLEVSPLIKEHWRYKGAEKKTENSLAARCWGCHVTE